MKRLLKFRYSPDEGVLIKYEKSIKGSGAFETITVESAEKPQKDLQAALQAMAAHLCAIAELPADWAEDLEIRGVTCTWTDGIRGLVITGLRKLEHSNAPLVLNSPHFTEAPYAEDGDDTVSVYDDGCGEDLETLDRLVFGYVDGAREQLRLELEAAPSAVLHATN
jgi:hypothetical protein